MKRLYIATVFLGAVLLGSGCKKFLDVNDNPNSPMDVGEKLILPPVEITVSTQVVGGFNGTNAAYWMQQLSQNQPSPGQETFKIFPVDVDNTWTFFIYPNILNNLRLMMNKARAAGHNEYMAIGKTLYAFNLAIATDLWGSVPNTDAMKLPEIIRPKYDSQESIYASLQTTLDSAIYFASQPKSAIAPGTDDLIFQGDMSKWKKFAYMLKARFYLRLTKAPGHTAAAQADLALAALANAFGDNSDNALVAYAGGAKKESPWFKNTEPGAGGVVMNKTFIDFLQGNNDPRLPIIATKDVDGGYTGRVPGATPVPDPDALSKVDSFYAADNASLYLATYSEALSIKAEATFYKSGAAAAQPIYQAAIKAHMDMLKVAAADAQAYINSRPALTATNALQQIIYEKYVAGFLSIETYNDWRRTGFPVLQLPQNMFGTGFPRRWPYPSNELLANPQPEQSATTADRVWWDTK
ncbi:SusD/RagB family nutrient-binding outer membrane lipoprotein [Chitinophaga qingshengii]|uniref:SusD/RagB family nutrient-binding outer membrane lipoprotein n=1 Tax=Chitinophaga qingshengii TaxID=1569794 RepID=A0ABR7TLA0_9BACT|nr:SusD/RagB family nutrient-binding outer membrane lipoprotein [Chitinophaga qingshengii]MBC9930738.1 SusD/RagB family nutrient-binding outer membrane lipoprotein [Chitinophaga qingshengii]